MHRVDITSKLVIIKSKDRTSAIRSLHEVSPYQYLVRFNSSPKTYTYSSDNLRIITKVQTIDPEKYAVTIDGEVRSGIKSIEDFDEFMRVVFSGGFTLSVMKSRIKLIRSSLDDEKSRKVFEYFKSVAHSVSIRTDSGDSILGKNFDSINFIREDTVLSSFLSGSIDTASPDQDESFADPIFPFGYNASQKKAALNAMLNKASIIEGPPGTGKTQTILNIVANMLSNNKTVAVVSNNNSATDNVYERLKAEGIDFIAARLGNSSNKNDFISSQDTPTKEYFDQFMLDTRTRNGLIVQARALSSEIDMLLESINERARLKGELQDVSTEFSHYKNYLKTLTLSTSPSFLYNTSSNRLLRLIDYFESRNEDSSPSIISRTVNFFNYGLVPNKFYRLKMAQQTAALKNIFYKRRIDEIENQILKLDQIIQESDYDALTSAHRKVSMKLLKAGLAAKYTKNPQRTDYRIDDLWKNSEKFISDYPVVLSTTHSLRTSLSTEQLYDYVIVDEASQVNLTTLVLALSCAKNVVIVGDKKQLPNVTDNETKRIDDEIFSRFALPEKYRYSSHSALSGISEVLGKNVPTQMLHEHYRCHRLIIGFCNKMFYDNSLVILTPDSNDGVEPLSVWRTPPGNHAREDRINQRQIDVTLDEVVPAEGLNLYDGSVGIVSPYRNHADALQERLRDTGTLAATVDKFQGREKDTIILNTVDNKISEFASNPNRLNVAVSRAKKRLIVVTDNNNNSSGTGIGQLIDYIKYHHFDEEHSNTRSIFDYLYRSYYKSTAKKARRGSSKAEDLMHELLETIRAEGALKNIDIVMEYPLRELCNTKKLTKDYAEFAEKSRVDFVLFDSITKRPILVIEVDGWTFHHSKSQKAHNQRIRDEKKNNILRHSQLPLLRFSTTGSGEKEKLIQMLLNISTDTPPGIEQADVTTNDRVRT